MKETEQAMVKATQAIVIRRVEYGDHDFILTFLTLHDGKLSAIAKNAKKSVKRFSGVLELFYELDVVIRHGRGMPYLQEASIINPNQGIRADIIKTAYASYWAEIIVQWLEEGVRQEAVYKLLAFVLETLSGNHKTPEELSILFQLKFLDLAGFSPGLTGCSVCEKTIDEIRGVRLLFDIEKGVLVCETCGRGADYGISLQKGTVKQMTWLIKEAMEESSRVRFTNQAASEGLRFLELFLPFHLEKDLKTLKFLRRTRTPI